MDIKTREETHKNQFPKTITSSKQAKAYKIPTAKVTWPTGAKRVKGKKVRDNRNGNAIMAILNVLSRGNNNITGYNDTARAHNDLAAPTAP